MPSSADPSPASQLRATVIGALAEGWRRVMRAPALAAGMWLLTCLMAAPLAMSVGDAIEHQLGSSMTADRVAGGWDPDWAGEFATTASGVSQTFAHEILGFGGTLAALSQLLDHGWPHRSLVAGVVGYVVLWTFFSGGILDRLARGRPVRTSAFFSACGGYLFRFLRLGAIVLACDWALFKWLHPLLFQTIYDRLTRDQAADHISMLWRAVLYAVFIVALALVNLVSDFSKVRMVVEDRRSAISALAASMRFIRRRFFRVSWLYILNVIVQLVIARLWLQTAPSASASIWLALLVGQVYLVLRLWARLAFMASEIVFFQGELAHARYTARPEPIWPDSPAVEAIRNLTRAGAQLENREPGARSRKPPR